MCIKTSYGFVSSNIRGACNLKWKDKLNDTGLLLTLKNDVVEFICFGDPFYIISINFRENEPCVMASIYFPVFNCFKRSRAHLIQSWTQFLRCWINSLPAIIGVIWKIVSFGPYFIPDMEIPKIRLKILLVLLFKVYSLEWILKTILSDVQIIHWIYIYIYSIYK